MSRLERLALIGNHLPRRCGIATFTHDLHGAIVSTSPHLNTSVVAMNDIGKTYAYPAAVTLTVRDDVIDDYKRAAAFLNTSRRQVVSLQHEFGIFGGEAGGHIVELISRLDMPVVTTLHTVLAAPSAAQARVMRRITSISARLVVMSEKGRALLQGTYGVPSDKIDVIAHGIPEYPFFEPMQAKTKLGFSGRAVILTFGLLSPSKGLEAVIDAMPEIIAACPTAVYVVLGATHPNLVRDQGESYRESLVARVSALGLKDHVVFLDQFVDQPTLLDFISMCDVYVTPYLNEAQMTSGTLAYSFGLGKAVVSTPYWHARELLAGGLGILVPFGDSAAIGREVAGLLRNDVRRHAMRKRAYAASRAMTWPQVAKRYVASFETAIEQRRTVLSVARSALRSRPVAHALPEFKSEYLLSMCDSTGLMQHAVHSIPDRSHGYCVDDNARALLLSASLAEADAPGLPEIVTTRFAAFVQHAWNPDNKRFRNFMSYDRRWLEAAGSDDSHGRTLWALAACGASDPDEARRRWAGSLFGAALGAAETLSSPRSWAFTLLALDVHCRRMPGDVAADRLRRVLADRLMALFKANERKDWLWFESVLAYDNARLSEALIRTGAATHMATYTSVGLQSLRWLMDLQVAPGGHFRPVGSHSFGRAHMPPEPFDQQPVEVAAAVSACLAAARVEASADWAARAMGAFNWFQGDNDLKVTLIDPRTGGCMDGLHPDRPNRNMGAESILSYLLSLVELRASLRASTTPENTTSPYALALRA